MNVSTHRIHYKYIDHESKKCWNAVTYAVYPGNQIVFTFNSPSIGDTRGSTISCSEEIIYTIAKQESLDARDFTFFDLQTNNGYTSHRDGEYSFSKLFIQWDEDKITRLDWVDGHCAEIVLQHFGGFIGTPPYKNHLGLMGGNTKITNTLRDLLDTVFEIMCMYEGDSMSEIRMECIERLTIPFRSFFKEQGIEDVSVEVIATFPRETLLGESSQTDFYEFCDWIVEKHPEFSEILTPVLFLN